mmetsp:Transcript_21776/g.41548  ORF Transcript_21776/g.41548 Transcript_21776/m.41548 type:complete len:262 (-) Transcript_21776:945-1730(-)
MRRLFRALLGEDFSGAGSVGRRGWGDVHGGGVLRARALRVAHLAHQPGRRRLHRHRHHRGVGHLQRARHHRGHRRRRGPGAVSGLEAARSRRNLLRPERASDVVLYRRRRGEHRGGSGPGGRLPGVRLFHGGERARVPVAGRRVPRACQNPPPGPNRTLQPRQQPGPRGRAPRTQRSKFSGRRSSRHAAPSFAWPRACAPERRQRGRGAGRRDGPTGEPGPDGLGDAHCGQVPEHCAHQHHGASLHQKHPEATAGARCCPG